MTSGRMVLLAMVSAVLLAAGGFAIYEMQSRPVRSVRIAGDLRYTSRVALEDAIFAEVAPSLYRVDVDRVREAALTLPWVKDASVRRVWPDSLHVAVIEREPVARWRAFGLLEASGFVFSPDIVEAFEHLPFLEGPKGSQAQVLDQYWALQEALRPIGWRLKRLSLNNRRAWRAELDSGVVLMLGQEQSVESVERLVRAFDGVSAARLAELDRVDLRYTNGFAVRWKRGAKARNEERHG